MTDDEIRAFFGGHSESSEWYDITDPFLVLNMPIVDISSADRLRDRKEMKRVFHAFGRVENKMDGRMVVFPAASVGKMWFMSGVDVYKTKGAELSTPIKTRAEDSAPFVDNKIALFLSAVNGVK